jgi:hypothetical protein
MHRLGNDVRVGLLATFVSNPDAPRIRDANHVSGITAAAPSDIAALLGQADGAFADFPHRRFDVDTRTPPQFVARLLMDGGYKRDDSLLLVIEGEPAGSASPADIRPVRSAAHWEAFWELMLLDWTEGEARQGRATGEDVAREMWRTKVRKQPFLQFWMAYVDERPVAYFSSWEGVNGVGQVEDLFTHPDFRMRGIAKSLIFHLRPGMPEGGRRPGGHRRGAIGYAEKPVPGPGVQTHGGRLQLLEGRPVVNIPAGAVSLSRTCLSLIVTSKLPGRL